MRYSALKHADVIVQMVEFVTLLNFKLHCFLEACFSEFEQKLR